MSDIATFSVHDAAVHTMHEADPDYTKSRELFHKVNRLLRSNGFTIGRDPDIEKKYKTLGPTHRRGRKGLLEVKTETGGRTVEVRFFQNVNFENRNGGEYDFNKLEKMPYLVRKSFEWIVAKLKALIIAEGYELRTPGPEWRVDPLGAFNHGWNGAYERKHGIERFSRGPDGWPDEKALSCWKQLDHDGRPIRSGEQRWAIVNGRALRCRVYGGINGMWHGVYGPDRFNVLQRGGWVYRSIFPGRGRHFDDDERKKALRRDLERALKANRFKRAMRICEYAERIGIKFYIDKASVGVAG
jgi:hypothetical protein